MANITPKTFPGVYTTVVDKSFFTPRTSNFRLGIVGVASKGPLGIPTRVISLKDFVSKFGKPLPTTYSTDNATNITTPTGNGFFLADAVDAVAGLTNDITVVRVGNQYTELQPSDAISGAPYVVNSAANAPRIKAMLDAGDTVYVRIQQPGKFSTVNALVTAATTTTITLDSGGSPLADSYSAATISYSKSGKAANEAEGVLYAYTYGSNSSSYADSPLTSVGPISGKKNDFEFYCASNASNIQVGSVYKIKESGKATTYEVRVKDVLINGDTSGTIYLERTDLAQIGYQALPLQDTYVSASLYKPTNKVPCLYFKASTPGTWANGNNASEGLYLKVRPGSKPGTKKLEVYWDSALVETHDNITDNPADTVNFWTVRLANGKSEYVSVTYATSLIPNNWVPANTVAPWDSRFNSSTPISGLPKPMPFGAINAGKVMVGSTVTDTGGQFGKGYNGENPSEQDWIGDLNPDTDNLTGIQAFQNTEAGSVNVLAAPMHNISTAIMEQLGRTAQEINAVVLCDVPAGLNAREATDWHNGKLPGQDGHRVDNRNVAIYWNWFLRTNRWGETKWVPPTVGVLRAMAQTFNADKPWYAVAGEVRGYLPEALKLQFERVSTDVKQSMYGDGNSVNPLLKIRGSHYIYGDRTLQRAESKLTALHSMVLVNWILTEMSNVARLFIFDPNDDELLVQLRLAFTSVLDRIANDRGIEAYNLVMDERNNTPETRNNREVIVDLEFIPVDAVEKIYINAIVRESGAQLNQAS